MGFLKWLFGEEQKETENKFDGFYIVRYDYGENQARNLFHRANAGDVAAQLKIAKCFCESLEYRYALPWYEKAAEAGSTEALNKLVSFYEGKYMDIEADYEKAERVRNLALKSNNPEALLKRGSQYYMGEGVEKDLEKAFQYYKKAAELRNDEAKAKVGLCYLNGEGVEQNDAQAFFWFSRSNDRYYGHYNLAQCYLKGIGTKKDLNKAVIYLEKAVAEKCIDLTSARKQLADLYRKGYGGGNKEAKLRQLEADMSRYDQLLDDLMKTF